MKKNAQDKNIQFIRLDQKAIINSFTPVEIKNAFIRDGEVDHQ